MARTTEQQPQATDVITVGYQHNATFDNEEDEEWFNGMQSTRKITLIITASFSMVISFYIVSVLTRNQVRSCRGPENTSNSDKKYRTLMEYSIYACSIFGFARFVMLGADCVIEAQQLSSCYVLDAFKIVTNTGAFVFAYLALWFRQRVFYISPSIRHITSLCTRILSIAVLPMLISTAVFFAVIFFMTTKHDLDRFGCVQTFFTAEKFHLKVAIGGALLVYQLNLLFLFLYPLLRHWKLTSKSSARHEGCQSVLLLRQALYVALAIITVDISATVLQETVDQGYDLVYASTEAAELLTYITCSCLLIPDWKRVMFPLCKKFHGK